MHQAVAAKSIVVVHCRMIDYRTMKHLIKCYVNLMHS